MYGSTLSLTSELDEGGWLTPHPGRFLSPGKDPVPTIQLAGWAPGPVWTGAEYLAPTRFRSPDHPARSQSLCRLSHPAHKRMILTVHVFIYKYILNQEKFLVTLIAMFSIYLTSE
jgi:hypothetical protein